MRQASQEIAGTKTFDGQFHPVTMGGHNNDFPGKTP